jgi:hypothetical protein
MGLDAKKSLAISNLMSPPEQIPFDNFSHGSSTSSMPSSASEQQTIGVRPPLSPPISPLSKPALTEESSPFSPSTSPADPILYPNSEASTTPRSSLFESRKESSETQKTVENHIVSRPTSLFERSPPPEREDYELALYFQSAVMQKFQANPREWLRKERDQLIADRRAALARKLPVILPATTAKPMVTRPLALRTTNPNKVKKPTASPKTPTSQSTGARAIRATPSGVPRQPVARSTIRVSSGTPEPRIRTVAPSREDKDFNSLPDYCPPLDSLPNKPNSLKVDWKGNALDLRADPDAWRLHPDELLLAAGLRLDCATYLTSKRRIFIRRLECMTQKPTKDFRKTDAQQACKIDVNKASKLWSAYEKVGWLDPKWMVKHIAAQKAQKAAKAA